MCIYTHGAFHEALKGTECMMLDSKTQNTKEQTRK